ncbi:uncharacterized protein LOC130714178 [Lotus japonicus]|uniref:uncharacterized protein LOC130714178 n=1 Tax=Lotus japonicus TaxID=34305 RepID=UPI002583425A|nr:uncharacterized protein LOC130714178 [Lotus japonicus]
MEFISSMQFSSHLSTERNHPHKIVSSLHGNTLPLTCNRIPLICCLGLIGKVADGGFFIDIPPKEILWKPWMNYISWMRFYCLSLFAQAILLRYRTAMRCIPLSDYTL